MCSDEAARRYVNKLGSPELSDSEFNALVACGYQATLPLVKALEDDRSEVRASAAYALGQIGSDAYAAVPNLISALDNPYLDVRALAAYALGQIGSSAGSAIPRLSETLRHPNENPVVRHQAADALRKIGTEAATAALTLTDEVPPVDEDWLIEECRSLQTSVEFFRMRLYSVYTDCNPLGLGLVSLGTSSSNRSSIATQVSTNLPLICRVPGVSSILPRCR